MVKSGSPGFTSWPSLKCTFAISPSSCDFTATSATGVTVPIASSSTGTLRRSASAIRTGTGGAAGGAAPREHASAPPRTSASAKARCPGRSRASGETASIEPSGERWG